MTYGLYYSQYIKHFHSGLRVEWSGGVLACPGWGVEAGGRHFDEIDALHPLFRHVLRENDENARDVFPVSAASSSLYLL